ncbi:hypothetical protein MHY1_00105 [Methylovirgula sp. HY1]|nr:hypothetical protein MHY1_00105 [Methylovirgula sp. HY1]
MFHACAALTTGEVDIVEKTLSKECDGPQGKSGDESKRGGGQLICGSGSFAHWSSGVRWRRLPPAKFARILDVLGDMRHRTNSSAPCARSVPDLPPKGASSAIVWKHGDLCAWGSSCAQRRRSLGVRHSNRKFNCPAANDGRMHWQCVPVRGTKRVSDHLTFIRNQERTVQSTLRCPALRHEASP